MQTMQWKPERIGSGRYHVRLIPIGGKTGDRIPGLILEGSGKWIVELRGNQIPQVFKTLNAACAYLASDHIGI